jgi:hypothetical protein
MISLHSPDVSFPKRTSISYRLDRSDSTLPSATATHHDSAQLPLPWRYLQETSLELCNSIEFPLPYRCFHSNSNRSNIPSSTVVSTSTLLDRLHLLIHALVRYVHLIHTNKSSQADKLEVFVFVVGQQDFNIPLFCHYQHKDYKKHNTDSELIYNGTTMYLVEEGATHLGIRTNIITTMQNQAGRGEYNHKCKTCDYKHCFRNC